LNGMDLFIFCQNKLGGFIQTLASYVNHVTLSENCVMHRGHKGLKFTLKSFSYPPNLSHA